MTGRRAIGAFATLTALAALAVAGCASKSLTPTVDAAADHPVAVTDAAGCMCQADTQTLTISWDCYCQLYSCNGIETITNCAGTPGVWTRGCGFDEYTVDTAGGPEIWVYDQTGKLVGAQMATDDSVFACPDNHGLQRFLMRAGQFRPETCNGVATCNCADTDASVHAICVTGDGGFVSL
jgi:hypothetical protein